ncbi:hypothetical protein HPB51_011009 [Rhipicephalus microplus]|uniref:Uncharacterized protein n=1 Tax=Rhipicephalus microplus TaxID=6941 RepID=A0A9J6ENZ4_RHIMP|nr:hypothetical protein HPB51_011009 [Rhipicephalus microplus]
MRRSQSKSRRKSQDRPLETLNNTPGTTSKTSITTLVLILQKNRAACEERPESPPAKKPASTGQTPPTKSLSRTTDMGGEEKMGQNSAIGGGHGKTKQAGTSEDNARRPEDKLNAKTEDMDHQDADTTIDNASPTITATVASATSTTMGAPGTTAAVPGTSDSTTPPPDTSATAAPGTATDKTDCLETAENKTDLALPMASSNSSSDAVPSASPAGKAAESAANSSMHGQQLKCLDSKATSEHLTCLATAELRPEDKLNAKLEDMDHQDADTTIDNASPTITATVASATSTTMGAPGTTAAVPGTSNSTTPPPDTSAQAAPGTATDKTDCLETADNKTDLALPMASCDSSSDAVPSASRTDKAAESAANNSMQWLHSKYLDCEAASEYLSCSAPAELYVTHHK